MTPRRMALLAVCLLAGIVHVNTLSNDFALDDTFVVRESENVHGIAHLWDAVTGPYWDIEPPRIGMYRPLTSASFAIDWELWKGHPAGFHATNVLLHVVITALVFLLVLRLVPNLLVAGISGAVFAVHPVHVEAVANVVGRGELLAALFYLLACLAFLRMRPGWRSTVVISGAYFLAVAAKEIAVTLPGALILLELAAARGHGTAGDVAEGAVADRAPAFGDVLRRLVARWPLFLALTAALALYLALRFVVLGELLGTGTAAWFWGMPENARVFTAVRVWPEYVRLMLFPLVLSADYGPSLIVPEAGFHGLVLLGLATGAVALAVAAATWRRARLVAIGILWFMLVVLPVSNIPFATGVIMAERTLYLPSVGLALGLAGALAVLRLERPAWIRPAVAVLVLATVAGGVRTWLRNPTWKDTNAVLNTLIQDHPGSYRAQWAVADQQIRQGNLEEGLARYRVALEMVPGYYSLRMQYAAHLYHDQQFEEAARQYGIARGIIPDAPRGHTFYLTSLVRAGNLDRALEVAPGILELYPGSGAIRHQYARALAKAGLYEEAAIQRRAAIDRTAAPLHSRQWTNMAAIQLVRGDTAAALAALDSALATTVDSASVPGLEGLKQGLARGDTTVVPFW